MDPVIKQLWTTGLRSGQFTQGKHSLRNTDKGHIEMCCLGVLCELHRQQPDSTGHWDESSGYQASADYADRGVNVLPYSVRLWAGLANNVEGHNPIVRGQMLSSYNDGILNGAEIPTSTFAQIADLIDEYL